MAVATSVLRSEMRRHLAMNLGLVAALVIGGTVVTNERGLFVPLGMHGASETAKAFAAMFTPSHLLPNFTNVKMVVPLEPFDVTADSRDLRRRLMDVADTTGNVGDDAATQATQLAQGAGNPLTVTELADNSVNPRSADTSSTPGGSPGSFDNPFPASPPSIVGSSLGPTNDTPNPPSSTPIDTPGGGTPGGGTAVPEPSMWVMLLAGFGSVGYALRAARRRRIQAA